MHYSRVRSGGRGSRSCSCIDDHLDPDEMCDKCRDEHFQRIVGHREFLHDASRDEELLARLEGIGCCHLN